MNPGQRRAVAELRALAERSNGALALTGEVTESDAFVKVSIRVSTRGTRYYPGGLRLAPTEDFEIWVGTDAPLHPPHLVASDARWATSPHVTGRSICLYIDAATQWSPSDGMYGFVHRMGEWFIAAAAGDLDPDGGPLHPPVALGIGYSKTDLVIAADIPDGKHRRMLWANLQPRANHRIDVTGFHRFEPKATEHRAAVILANEPLVGDYASTYGALCGQLQPLGFTTDRIAKHLLQTAIKNPNGSPLIVLVGTLNRRIDRDRFHHLVGWELPASLADRFRSMVTTDSEEEIDATLDAANSWAANEPLAWTHLYEARPSVTRRRDSTASMSSLAGKTVEIWGCGTLGGWMAEFVARAGPDMLRLRDRSMVGPGLVVRQPYDDADITRPKAHALADRLRRINDCGLTIEGTFTDVTKPETIASALAEADLIVDTTANRSVATAIDRYAAVNPAHPPIVSISTDARCELTALFTSPGGSAGPGYTARAALRRLARSPQHQRLLDAFWGSAGLEDLVQPEPGCSAPTFHGSAADAANAASTLANQMADWFATADSRTAQFTALAHSPKPLASNPVSVETTNPLRIEANDGYTVFISAEASAVIERLARETFATDQPAETGGLLFGERDDASLAVTVDAATGPPADSTHSPAGFERGTAGTNETVAAFTHDTLGGATYLGDWHTHPRGVAALSATDRRAATDRDDGASLILIWAGEPDNVNWAAHVIDTTGPTHTTAPPQAPAPPAPALLPTAPRRGRDRAARHRCDSAMPPRRALRATRPDRPAILVALSGGGFRATLAGLGVLRFLVDADLIADTRIISSVSGGSLANAAMAARWGHAATQPGFDDHVLGPVLDAITGRSFRNDLLLNSWRALRPGSSRTTVLADRLDKHFLHKQRLEDLPAGCWFMFNAANVTEGIRFRFDADVVGDYVNGSIPTTGTDLRVATAVAASAAVPGPFPTLALDHLDFPCNTGQPVQLADGGVYDNLGLEAIQRERTDFESSFLVSLNAGSLLPANTRAGFGRIPIAGKLWRANAVMHRQTSALRTRRLFHESAQADGRPFVTFNLATSFPTDLTADQRQRLDRWRSLNEEHDAPAQEALAAIPTTFARIDRADALALVQRSWWLTGATLTVHHPWLLETSPVWRTPAAS